MESPVKPIDIYDADHLYAVASMYYNEDMSQSEIATQLKVSRPTISRMLSQARETGIVRISVSHPNADSNAALAQELKEALGLTQVYLAQGFQNSTLGPGVEPAVIAAIQDMQLKPGGALVVSSGLAMHSITDMNLPKLPGVTLVPSVGGLAEPEPWHQPNEIVRAMAQKTGSNFTPIFARAIPTQLMYDALQEDDLYIETTKYWKHAQGALVGVGSPTTGRTSIASGIPQNELTNSVGDVCLHFFTAEGRELEFTGSDRIVRIPLKELQAIPHSVAVAVGAEKVTSIIASSHMKLYKKLVTDEATAKLILQQLA